MPVMPTPPTVSLRTAARLLRALRRRLAKAEWDESQHPRDERGRWTDATTGETYHLSKLKAGDGVRYKITVGGKAVGDIAGFEHQPERGDFHLYKTGLSDESYRGTGLYRAALQEVADQYSRGVWVYQWEASAALRKSLKKMPTYSYEAKEDRLRIAPINAASKGLKAEWNEADHPRVPAGSGDPSGQFTSGDGGTATADAAKPTVTLDPEVIDVGGDQWNQETARRLEEEFQRAKPALDQLVAEANAKREAMQTGNAPAPKPEPEPEEDEEAAYVPESWDELSNEQQEEVEEAWKKDNYDSFYEDEEQNWRYEDEYGARATARQEVSEDENFYKETAEDFMTDYEDGTLPPDLTAEMIASAVSVDPDTGDVEIDAEKFTPSSYDPNQQDLLGGATPPSLLDQVIDEGSGATLRDELTRKFDTAFEKAADKLIDNLEPPDYLDERVRESLDHNWEEKSDKEKWKDAQDVLELGDGPSKPPEKTPTLQSRYSYPPEPSEWVFDEPSGNFEQSVKLNYKETQQFMRYLARERAVQLLQERKVDYRHPDDQSRGTPEYPTEDALRQNVEWVDRTLWDAWKSNSHNMASKIHQLAVAQELGGRERFTDEEEREIIDASKTWSGSLPAIRAIARAKWETTQYAMSKAGVKEQSLYRAIYMDEKADLANAKISEHTVQYPGYSDRQVAKIDNFSVHRNGLASTSSKDVVANDWNGVGNLPPNAVRVVIRMRVPRTAVYSVPAYGQNIHGEHEFVIAGTAWKSWDAWRKHAPGPNQIPIKRVQGMMTKASPGIDTRNGLITVDLNAYEEGLRLPHWLSGLRAKRYNPNQPRVPAGSGETSGQWTSGDVVGGGTAHRQVFEKLNPNGKDTREQFSKDGNWTHDRAAMQLQIQETQSFAGRTPVADPKVYVMGGGPASAKSTLTESGLLGVEKARAADNNLVWIDADDYKWNLPEMQEMIDAGRADEAAAFVHEESSYMTKQALLRAGRDGYNTMYDSVGDGSVENLAKKLELLRARGQKIVAHYTTLPTDLAVKIAQARAEKEHRHVNLDLVRDLHESVSRIFPQAIARGLFDEVTLWDTRIKGKPVKIGSGKGSNFIIHDRALYREFINKAVGKGVRHAGRRRIDHDCEGVGTRHAADVDHAGSAGEARAVRSRDGADQGGDQEKRRGLRPAQRLKDWDEAQHPRVPAGSGDESGQFASAGGGAAVADAPSGDVTQSEAFQRWFGDSKVTNQDGTPKIVYHGTTHEFTEFQPAGSENYNIENHWGAGIYFSDGADDISENYAREGPDLTGRVDQRADQLQNENLELSREDAERQAREELVGSAPSALPVYLSFQNPAIFGKGDDGQQETYFDYTYDEETGDEGGKLTDFIMSLRRVADQFEDATVDDYVAALLEEASGEGISASKLDDLFRRDEKISYAMDWNTGASASGELMRRTLEDVGFDSIIDHQAFGKFGGGRSGGGMPGVYQSTTHYVAFTPTQIKSATGNRGTFDPNDPDVRKGYPEFDPAQPRNDAGRWVGDGTTETPESGLAPKTHAALKTRLQGVPLAQVDAQLLAWSRETEREYGAIHDRNGTLLAARIGGKHKITWTNHETGPIVTHTHPTGGPPSMGDLRAARLFNAEVMRVISDPIAGPQPVLYELNFNGKYPSRTALEQAIPLMERDAKQAYKDWLTANPHANYAEQLRQWDTERAKVLEATSKGVGWTFTQTPLAAPKRSS